MASAELRVEVVLAAGPHETQCHALVLPAGATVADAMRACGLAQLFAAAGDAALQLGCWGRPCETGTVLRDRDRVELTRPLQVDPKEARRLRHRRDGLERSARRSRG